MARSGSIAISHALLLMRDFANESNSEGMKTVTQDLLGTSVESDIYLAAGLGPWIADFPSIFFPFLAEISMKYPENEIIRDAVFSSVSGFEGNVLGIGGSEYTREILSQIEMDKENNNKNSIFVNEGVSEDGRTSGDDHTGHQPA